MATHCSCKECGAITACSVFDLLDDKDKRMQELIAERDTAWSTIETLHKRLAEYEKQYAEHVSFVKWMAELDRFLRGNKTLTAFKIVYFSYADVCARKNEIPDGEVEVE